MKYQVELSDEEEKALSAVMVSVQEWLDNAIHNRARIAMDALIEDKTDRQARKMSFEAKSALIREMKVETAIERNARLEVEMANG